MKKKKVIFSGIKPSGELTLGNYLGALKPWAELQNNYDTYYCVVDLHAITVKQEPKDLRRRTWQNLAIYIAAGLDPEKNTFFIQSHVPAHAELAWILNCYLYIGEMSRMTQYKSEVAKRREAIGLGILTYPSLMAADILLYQTDLVPVGKDQHQHLELTRDIAVRFNNMYSETFMIPETFSSKTSAKIMDLQTPSKKMDKSDDNPNGVIYIMDSPETIRKKISRAITDNVGIINYSDEQAGIKNLVNIFASIEKISPEEVVDFYKGKGYAELKSDVAESIIKELAPVKERTTKLLEDKKMLEAIVKEGAKRANDVAVKTLRKVKKKIGFIQFR